MKFCQRENIETHFWKILYHNIIEQLKKLINEDSPELAKEYTSLLMNLIEEVCNLKYHLFFYIINIINFFFHLGYEVYE